MAFWNKPNGIDTGHDGTSDYTNNKKVSFWMYFDDKDIEVAFKPFIEGLTISIDNEVKETDTLSDLKDIQVTGTKFSYKFTLNIMSVSINEAKRNLAELEKLKKASADTTGRTKDWAGSYFLLSNLICNGDAKKFISFKNSPKNNPRSFPKIAARGYLSSVSYSVDDSLGYFEYGGKLYPKMFSCSFEILMNPLISDNNYSILGYDTDGTYNRSSINEGC